MDFHRVVIKRARWTCAEIFFTQLTRLGIKERFRVYNFPITIIPIRHHIVSLAYWVLSFPSCF